MRHDAAASTERLPPDAQRHSRRQYRSAPRAGAYARRPTCFGYVVTSADEIDNLRRRAEVRCYL